MLNSSFNSTTDKLALIIYDISKVTEITDMHVSLIVETFVHIHKTITSIPKRQTEKEKNIVSATITLWICLSGSLSLAKTTLNIQTQ